MSVHSHSVCKTDIGISCAISDLNKRSYSVVGPGLKVCEPLDRRSCDFMQRKLRSAQNDTSQLFVLIILTQFFALKSSKRTLISLVNFVNKNERKAKKEILKLSQA